VNNAINMVYNEEKEGGQRRGSRPVSIEMRSASGRNVGRWGKALERGLNVVSQAIPPITSLLHHTLDRPRFRD
jgi:hypothetical protein